MKNVRHQYYVDGPATVGDACFNTSCASKDDWRSVLVGSLGAGGRTLYALDITDPASFDGTKVMWEFSHPELGFVIGKPLIARLNDGNWYSIVGNGYESFTCSAATPRYTNDVAGLPICTGSATDVRGAKLFVIKLNPDLSDGWTYNQDYFIVETTGTTNNALAMPDGFKSFKGMTGDVDGDFKTDLLYAGDLRGYLWRFDLTAALQSSWAAKYIFQAKDSSSNEQPISSSPAIMKHPTTSGYIVVFGTGQYLYPDDAANQRTQTLYGIWDDTASDPSWVVSV